VADTEEALHSVAPNLERVFIGARQELITSEQLQTQIAEGIVTGLTPQEMSRGIQRALRTGAVEQLQGRVPGELIDQLRETAEGRFITLRCRDGRLRRYKLPYYSKMVTRTARSMAANEGALQAAVEFGMDLVQVSVHVGACPICIPEQGVVYSLTGETPGFPLLTEERRLPLHPWCAHRYLPTTPETLEVGGSLDTLRRFSSDTHHAVRGTDEYLKVMAGESRGYSMERAIAEATPQVAS